MHLAALYRHPVKSLGSERLDSVPLKAGEAMPGDRAFAVLHGDSAFDPENPVWVPCGNFLRIANIPALAQAVLAFDPESDLLRLTMDGEATTYDLSHAEGRAALARVMGHHAGTIRPGPYRVARVPGVSLTDSDDQAPSIMSLASLRDLSARIGVGMDARRFRGNLWLDGDDLEPWAENSWAGNSLHIGAAELTVIEPIERCLATAANPETGQRDTNPLPTLKTLADAPLFGVTAKVVVGASVAVGDAANIYITDT